MFRVDIENDFEGTWVLRCFGASVLWGHFGGTLGVLWTPKSDQIAKTTLNTD